LLGILTFGLLNKDRKNAKQGGIGAGGKKPTGNRSGDGASAASSAGSASRENRSAMGAGPGRAGENPTSSGPTASRPAKREPQPLQPVDLDSVTTPKLHVGNLSYDAVESDLFNLFNGVGKVRNAEIVTHSKTQRSKGFGFVLMSSVEEAKRAVQELHGKSFIGGRVMTVLPARSGPPPGSQDREEGAETE
jgi:RNA recognition motif-containing protein